MARLVEVYVEHEIARRDFGFGGRFAIPAVERLEPAEHDQEHHAHVVLFRRRHGVLALTQYDAARGNAGDGNEGIEIDRVAWPERAGVFTNRSLVVLERLLVLLRRRQAALLVSTVEVLQHPHSRD